MAHLVAIHLSRGFLHLGMVLNLEAVALQNLTGWGAVLGSLAGNWLEQVVAKVCSKLLNSPQRPLHLIIDICGTACIQIFDEVGSK